MICRSCRNQERASEGYPCAKCGTFKMPKRVFLVEDLPRNAMGKVQKNELRKRYAETFK